LDIFIIIIKQQQQKMTRTDDCDWDQHVFIDCDTSFKGITQIKITMARPYSREPDINPYVSDTHDYFVQTLIPSLVLSIAVSLVLVGLHFIIMFA